MNNMTIYTKASPENILHAVTKGKTGSSKRD
jgi:hypothetical protein